MQLRTRLTASVTALVVALGGMGAIALALQQQRHVQQLDEALLAHQALAWSKTQEAVMKVLQRDVEKLAHTAGVAAALSAQDRARLAALSDAAAHAVDGRRVDFYDAREQLAYTSSSDVDSGRLLSAARLSQLHANVSTLAAGVTRIPRRDMFWFASLTIRNARGGRVGTVALAEPVAPALQALSQSLNAELFLASSGGREIAATGPRHLEPLRVTFDPLKAQAQHVSVPSETADAVPGRRDLVVASLPIMNIAERTIGLLVAVRDETEQTQQDHAFTAGFVVAILALALGTAGWLWRHLQKSFEPLRASVAVLEALAAGERAQSIGDLWYERRDDEAGAIAKGVMALREKVLDLALLQEEQRRLGEQQERLIRREMRRLAETIDEESRGNVLGELEVDGAEDNTLARLSGTFGRMTNLISSQHSRLVDAMKELQASLVTRTLFESLQRELEIARNMQQAILPRLAPKASAVDVSALMVPAKEVGGDFYDYFVLHRDGVAHLVVVVADVSGKGIPAALFMAITRTLIKGHARRVLSPAQTLALVNDELAEDNEQMMFVTIFLAVINLASGEMTYVNAGHNPPLLRRGDAVSRLEAPRNMALGIAPALTFMEARMVLERGQQLFLYTDGVTEAVGPGEVFFGEDALLRTLRESPEEASVIAQTVLGEVRHFADQEPQADDITCVVVEYRGPA